MKLAGSNFKANRRRYFFIQHVRVQWLNFLPQKVEDAIRQTDKRTQNRQWSVKHKSLKTKGLFWKSVSLHLGHLLLTTISSVSLFCGETGFYSGKYLYCIIYLSSTLTPLNTAAKSPLCSHALWSRTRRSYSGTYCSLQHGKHSDHCCSKCQSLARKQS